MPVHRGFSVASEDRFGFALTQNIPIVGMGNLGLQGAHRESNAATLLAWISSR